MGRKMKLATTDDIKTVLRYFEALGFERLPIEVPNPSELSREEKAKALEALRMEMGDCQRCKLWRDRKNLVFGEGNPDAELMFIGEAPGREEDIQGRPFVGDAGKLLTRLINKMGFKREDVYIANILKSRPPGNRDPEADEINACLPFLKRQVEIIAPEVIMSLGRISAHTLTGLNIPISRLRGKFYEFQDIPLMPTFHPAYLLRNPKDKQLVWSDAQQVLGLLGRRMD
jgi:DNA polymerase